MIKFKKIPQQEINSPSNLSRGLDLIRQTQRVLDLHNNRPSAITKATLDWYIAELRNNFGIDFYKL